MGMNFKKTIIITDPGYFAKDEDWGDKFDFDELIIDKDLGFTDYIWTTTGYGDGSWGIYGIDKISGQIELEDHINKVIELKSDFGVSTEKSTKLQNLLKKETVLGEFSVDSGTFGIFYLDEVLKYNPNFLADIGNWCYTIITDFIGLVEVDESNVYDDDDEEISKDFCIKGIGNKTFYSR